MLDAFEQKHSASALQLQINSVRMGQNEDVNSYSDRVEKLYYKIYSANTENITGREIIDN